LAVTPKPSAMKAPSAPPAMSRAVFMSVLPSRPDVHAPGFGRHGYI
jgi:hypothetical protein